MAANGLISWFLAYVKPRPARRATLAYNRQRRPDDHVDAILRLLRDEEVVPDWRRRSPDERR